MEDFVFHQWAYFIRVKGHDIKLDITQKLLIIFTKVLVSDSTHLPDPKTL